MIKPLSDWLLVQLDPRAKRSDVIEIAGDNDTSAVRTGTVLRCGPGRWDRKGRRVDIGIKPDDRICFLRWHEEHRPGKVLKALVQAVLGDDKDVMLIRSNDILFQFDGTISVDIP